MKKGRLRYRHVRITFITALLAADDKEAYDFADQEVAELDPPGDWTLEGIEVVPLPPEPVAG